MIPGIVACPKIVGGCTVQDNSWPSILTVNDDRYNNDDTKLYISQKCGASLLSDRCALVAAHCDVV